MNGLYHPMMMSPRPSFAVSLKAFEVDGDGFADVVGGFFERIAFGMTAGQCRAGSVVAPAGLCFKDDGVSHGR